MGSECARRRPLLLRLGVDVVLLGALGLLIAFGFASPTRSDRRIYPGPRPVSVAGTRRCLVAATALTVTRVGASAVVVGFANGAAVRLAFVASEEQAMRSAPWSFAPALTRSSLNNVVITRAGRAVRPPRASLRVLGRCLVP